MTQSYVSRVLEVVLARVVPGAVNVLSILWLGKIMETDVYGLFSVGLATSVMISNLSFGLIAYTVVPRHAQLTESGQKDDFEAKAMGGAIVISLIVLALGWLASALALLPISYILLIIAMGFFSTVQSILRARLQFWRYGLAALAQATALLSLLLILADPATGATTVLVFYMVGYAIGACVSFVLIGIRSPTPPGRKYVVDIFSTGFHFTIANLAENALQLGFRYGLLLFAPPIVLGVFSFALDMAQRLVGVVLNITSFALLPLIYKSLAKGDAQKSRRFMWQGNLFSGGVALLTLFGTMLVIKLEVIVALNPSTMSLPAFFFVSLAVIINRLKKISLDPLAVKSGRTGYLAVAHGLATPASFGLAAGLSVYSLEQLTYPAYMLVYLFVTALTARLLGVAWGKLVHSWASVHAFEQDRTGTK